MVNVKYVYVSEIGHEPDLIWSIIFRVVYWLGILGEIILFTVYPECNSRSAKCVRRLWVHQIYENTNSRPLEGKSSKFLP